MTDITTPNTIGDPVHYQDAPQFIGPRLPQDHPAYVAHLARLRRERDRAQFDHGATPTASIPPCAAE